MATVTVTKDNFDSVVLQSNKTVILDFWATWCGPCRMIAPIVEEIVEENEDLLLGKINVDEEMELAVRFQISSIPTLIVIRDGQAVKTMVGCRPKQDILKLLEL